MHFHLNFQTISFCIGFISHILITNDTSGQALVKANCLIPYQINISDEFLELNRDVGIRYEDHDDHTFWYKLEVSENGRLSYDFSSLDDQDNFDLYLYNHSGNNFCRSFIQGNLDVISVEGNVNLKVGKDEVYYLGIFPLFPGGCGHKLELSFNGLPFTLTAQNDKKKCFEDERILNPEPVVEKGMLEVNGMVHDIQTRNPINANVLLLDPFTNHELELISNDLEGFIARLYEDGDYKIKIHAFGYKELVSVLPAYEGEVYHFNLEWSDADRFVLNHVYFYPNTYALKDGSQSELESIYSFMVNHPSTGIEIIGHTNGNKDIKASKLMSEKGPEWNYSGTARGLSLERSGVIKEFLKKKGIEAVRINVVGKGGEEMIVDDPQNMRQAMKNIRVEIVVLRN